ncbi:MAG: hypothetical protein HGA22_12705, partial [Clostridiales bacterium]|nr:hypothetical protein [Clostridiales bacterium]
MIIKDLIQKRKMTLFSWVISYIVILVFPIIISSFAYSASVKTVIDEVNRVHNESLMNFKLYMDKEISNIKRITSEISVDYKVKQLMTAEVPIPQAIMYKSVEIQKYLKELEMCNEGIDEIYIYFRKGNFILTPDNIYRGDRIPELYKEGLNLDDAEFEDLVNHARQFDCKLINEVPGNGADTKMAIFTKAIFSASRETPHAVIIITMNKEKLNLEIGNTDNWTGTVIVRNNRDEFISSAKKQLLPDFLYTSEMKDSASVFNVSYDNTQTIVNHIKSDFFNLEYICLVPSKAYLHKVNYVKSIIFAYIGFCLVVGVITAFLVARKNFRPVRRLSQMLVDNLGISAFESRNEFRFLEDSLRELLREKENAKGIISQQSEALRNNILKRVITGRFCKPISIMESLKLSGINLISDYFLVMIFSIKNLDDFFRDEDSDDDAFERVFFIIRNITEELVGEKHAGFVTEAGGMAVCLVNLSADQGKLPDEAKTMEEMLE